MSFTFDTTIPNAANNPSVDQPGMQSNNVSTNGILAIDHITFNLLGGGQHQQVTFNNKNTPGAQTDPQSVLYTASGVASSIADMRFKNQNSIFPVNLVRAYGVFDATGTIVSSQAINLTSSAPVAGVFTLTIATGAVNGVTASFGVLITPNQTGLGTILAPVYAYSTPTSFVVGFRSSNTGGLTVPANGFTCVVFQL